MLICLATYNGANWLALQLDSLLDQQDQDWQLLVSDDGSSDATLEILQDYLRRDSRIALLPQRIGASGPSANFEYLLRHVQALKPQSDALISLCDQDDVWRRDKLTLNRRRLQSQFGCCSDLALTRADGRMTGQSLLSQLASPRQISVESLLAQNSAVGCTLAFRAGVLELALPFPEGLLNHDWWLALCICVGGGLDLIEEPLVHYRQHAHNAVGAYRPMQQLLKSRALLARQHRVLRSQYQAIDVLRDRLRAQGEIVPEALHNYLHILGARSARRRFGGLVRGPFAAPHKPLRVLRSLAALRSLR